MPSYFYTFPCGSPCSLDPSITVTETPRTHLFFTPFPSRFLGLSLLSPLDHFIVHSEVPKITVPLIWATSRAPAVNERIKNKVVPQIEIAYWLTMTILSMSSDNKPVSSFYLPPPLSFSLTQTLTHTHTKFTVVLRPRLTLSLPSFMVSLVLSQAINLAIACAYWSAWHRLCNPFSSAKRLPPCPVRSQQSIVFSTDVPPQLPLINTYANTREVLHVKGRGVVQPSLTSDSTFCSSLVEVNSLNQFTHSLVAEMRITSFHPLKLSG